MTGDCSKNKYDFVKKKEKKMNSNLNTASTLLSLREYLFSGPLAQHNTGQRDTDVHTNT